VAGDGGWVFAVKGVVHTKKNLVRAERVDRDAWAKMDMFENNTQPHVEVHSSLIPNGQYWEPLENCAVEASAPHPPLPQREQRPGGGGVLVWLDGSRGSPKHSPKKDRSREPHLSHLIPTHRNQQRSEQIVVGLGTLGIKESSTRVRAGMPPAQNCG